MRIAILLLVLSCDADNYYGLPIGSIHNEELGLFVDVYVANPHTIVMVGNKENIAKHNFKDLSIMICHNNFTLLEKYNISKNSFEKNDNICTNLIQSDFSHSKRWKREHFKNSDLMINLLKNISWNNVEDSVSLSMKNDNDSLVIKSSLQFELQQHKTSSSKLRSVKYRIKRINKNGISKNAENETDVEDEKREAVLRNDTGKRIAHSSSILISPIQEEIIIVFNSQGTLLQDYSWLGVWLHEAQRFYPVLSVENIEPPREENIGYFTKTNGFTASVVILNCNTILIQNIEMRKEKQISFFAGIGAPIARLHDDFRCSVLGYTGPVHGDAAEGSDLLILLPEGLRTFDIDFLHVYEHTTRTFVAQVNIPNVLVPPCD